MLPCRAVLCVKLYYSKSHYTNNTKRVLQNGFWRHCVSDKDGDRILCAFPAQKGCSSTPPVNLFALVLSHLLQK